MTNITTDRADSDRRGRKTSHLLSEESGNGEENVNNEESRNGEESGNSEEG